MADLPEVVYGVSTAEVAKSLRGLERGWYSSADLYARYVKVCEQNGHFAATRSHFGQALRAMWVMPTLYRRELRGTGRLIDVKELELYWPRLPWRA